jgi:hypothetical protein
MAGKLNLGITFTSYDRVVDDELRKKTKNGEVIKVKKIKK